MRRRVVEMSDYESESLLLLDVVQALVDNPEAAIVKSRPMSDSEGVVLTIHCAEDDRGRVIGRRGKTIEALRFLFSTIASVHDRKVVVRVEG